MDDSNQKKNIADSIMEKIEKEKIVPKPRWEFLLKNYFIWSVGIASVLVGGAVTSTVIFAIRNSDWTSYQRLSGNPEVHALRVLPFLWLLLLLVFVLLAIYQLKHTKRGYRYSVIMLVVINIFVSGLLGIILYRGGYGHLIDARAGRFIPAYVGIEGRREEMWVQPDRGLLAGLIIGTTTENVLILEDFKGNRWQVFMEQRTPIDTLVLFSMDEVRFVGNRIGTSTFEACAVRPWEMRGRNEGLHNEMRKKVFEQDSNMMEGFPPPPMKILQGEELSVRERNFRERLEEEGLNERNINDLRTIICERGTTTLQSFPGSL